MEAVENVGGDQIVYEDIQKTCKEVDCKNPFVLASGEQRFFATHALDERGNVVRVREGSTREELEAAGLKKMFMPSRCPDCRKKFRNKKTSPFNVLKGKGFPDPGTGKEPASLGIGKEGQE